MGQKVNYNKNSSKLKLIVIIFVGLIILLILIKSIGNVFKELPNENAEQNNNQALVYKPMEEYKTIGDVLKSFDCTFIRQEVVDGVEKIYLSFDVGLYTGNTSNETHFLNIAKAVASFLKYKNFGLIDTSKDIDIEVKCEEPNIIEFKINDDLNYYLNHNSNINKNLSTSITNFTIQSEELKDLIDSNWDESKVDFGTKESICNGYNIYFEEGIMYKNVAKNIFNVIFTENYKGQVAGTLKTTSKPNEVISALGDPTFKYNENVYGYLGEDNYLFFDFINKEISVYPVIKVNEDEEKLLKDLITEMNSSSDIKKFASNLTTNWIDYDVYDFDSNYVDLRYTLRGIQVSINSNSLKNGIFIYQNYSGDRNISDLDNVYIQETDFVFEEEKNRSLNENMCRNEVGDFTDEYYEDYLGNDFSVRFNTLKSTENDYFIGAKFYSRDKEYPDSELDKNLEISSYFWYDDYKFIYSVDDDGLYVYNCISRQNVKIIDLDGNIEIKSAKDGQIIYNDNQILNVEID